jgi:hypothetical protein
VAVDSHADGSVTLTLYERWFDGASLRCEALARVDFDASFDDTLVDSAEKLAELRAWAQARNAEREAAYCDAREDDALRVERSTARSAAAEQLAAILSSVEE